MKPSDHAYLAEFLLESAEVIPSDPNEWNGMQEARLRTAVNRAYYSLFLFLKVRLEQARKSWTLPQHDVHSKLRRAVEAELGYGHLITQSLRDLHRERRKADYEVGPWLNVRETEDLIDVSMDAMNEAARLDPKIYVGIAGALAVS